MITFNETYENMPFSHARGPNGFFRAKQVNETFRIKNTVTTPPTFQNGSAGDYLVLAESGEMSIIDKETFEQTSILID